MLDIKVISKNLELGKDGIWYSNDTDSLSYPHDGNEDCFNVESRSFWFRHRNNCIITSVKLYPPKDNGTIFDVGGGNGFVSLALTESGFDVALVEPGKNGVKNAKSRGLKNIICSTIENAHFEPHSLPAVGLFDVVEHLEQDLLFLRSIWSLLEKEGRLYITVPAYSFLWSQEDVKAGHYKRYTLKNLCGLIKEAGFEVEFCTHFFRFLPIPIALSRVLPYRLGLSKQVDIAQNPTRTHITKAGISSKVLSRLLAPEVNNLRFKRSMAFGSSCLAVARRL